MVNNKDLEFLIHEFASMGFDPQDIIMAWFNSNQRKAQVLDHLLAIAKEKGKGKANDISQNNNELNQSQAALEEQIQKAIQMSIEEGDNYIKPSQLLRSNGKPVGLKNVGNTCYFNSLIQTIFQLPEFLSIILSYRAPADIDQALANLKITDATVIKRKKGCIKLVLALRKLFVLMLFGNKNLVDPSEVTCCLIDANGSPMKIGEQLDIGEFSINLFERLEEGLQLDIGPETEDEVIIKKPVDFKELFFGTSKDFITFEWADFKSKKDQDAVFGPISLSIEQKDLMSSLDAYANFSVDGYQTPNGDITTAKKRIWITKAPKVMTFMLQRSVYDKEKGLMKANNPFTFPKEILIDRFLYENKRNLKEMLQENKLLKAKLLKIDDEIDKMHEYGKTKSDLLKTLETCAEFIDEQADNIADDFVEVHSDTSIDRIEDCGDVSELRKVSEILKKYQENCILRIEALKKKKQFIKDRIEKSFQNLQKFKYRLHSVVIHEGGINSGHYYTLIYNPKKNKWARFNDSVVQEISEEEAFKLATGGNEVQQNSLQSSPKNPCAYSLFYVEDKCEVLDFSPECVEGLKKLLSKELLSFAETENAKFLTEYQHYNAGLIQKINDEYFLKMNTLIFEASKFQKELKGKKFPFIPSIPNFTSFLLLETPKCTEIARWNALKTVLAHYKVPYNILEGEKKNYYYYELKELLVNKTSIYNLKSFELGESEKELLAQKKKEYLTLTQCLEILENIFELIYAKKWKETMATVSFLHEKIGQIKMNEYTNQFISFSSYLLSLISLRFCALIDRLQAKGETKEALKLLELMIFCLNRKESIKPPEIFYQQIIANLYYTINCTGRKNIKEADLFIFIHHIQKVEEKCEFLPSQDILSLLKPELRNQLLAIQNDQALFTNFDSRNINKLNDLFNACVKDRIKVWVDFEAFIRKGNILMDQDTRVQREMSVSD